MDSEHEANGVSFYGVGNGTTVEYAKTITVLTMALIFGGSGDVKNTWWLTNYR